MTVPLLPPKACDQLVSALHRASPSLGVIVGREGEDTRLILVTDAADKDAARIKATSLMVEAVEDVGLAQMLSSGMEIQDVVRRQIAPGRPRSVTAPALSGYRTVALPDGRMLQAAHEGPTADWIAYIEGSEDRAWAGRDLLEVLRELLKLPRGKKDAWVYEVIRQLAGRETPLGTRYACPCCDLLTLTEPPTGTFAICPVCRWEDDNIQFDDLDFEGGANTVSLRQARENVRLYGVRDPARREKTRPPRPEEQP